LVHDAANGLSSAITNTIKDANSAITSIVNKANSLTFNALNLDAPQISVPDLSSLQNVTLPSTIQDALTSLNNSIPSFDDLKHKIDDM
jgi:hypothetical protein